MMTKVREAFDVVQAEEPLKERTTQAVLQAMHAKAEHRRRRFVPVLALAACLLLAAGVGGHHLYFTPTTVLSIDINPSLEMDINRFDRVIALNGYNDDGVALAEALEVKNMQYDDAVDVLMANDTIEACLARGEELSIAVVQADGDAAQSDAVLEYVSGCTAQHENAHCYALSSDSAQMADAHSAGLSCGKYHMYQALLAYDATLTPETVQNMTMRELRDLLAQYEGETSAEGSSAQNGLGNGAQNGNGMQNGSGQGQGNGQGMHNGSGHSAHHGHSHE